MIKILAIGFQLLVIGISLSFSNFSQGAQLEFLKAYDGVYELQEGENPECVQRKFVELRYEHSLSRLTVDRLDAQGRRRGWQWLHFVPINEEPQVIENFFAHSRYNKVVAEETDVGWELKLLDRHCQLGFFCGRWETLQSIKLSNQQLEINVLAGSQQCSYKLVK